MHANKKCKTVFIAIILVVFSTSALGSNFTGARIMPMGKVLIHQGDTQVGELTAEAPFPDGALLACDGDCAVRMNDFFLVGADKSVFSITTRANSRELMVKNGTVYFALSQMPQGLTIATPNGTVTVQQLIMNAATNTDLLKVYVDVTEESSEIGVIEGGSMRISTVSGETKIQSGNKIVLSQTDGGQAPAGGAVSQQGIKPLAGGAIPPLLAGAGALALSIPAATTGNGSSGRPASPAAP